MDEIKKVSIETNAVTNIVLKEENGIAILSNPLPDSCNCNDDLIKFLNLAFASGDMSSSNIFLSKAGEVLREKGITHYVYTDADKEYSKRDLEIFSLNEYSDIVRVIIPRFESSKNKLHRDEVYDYFLELSSKGLLLGPNLKTMSVTKMQQMSADLEPEYIPVICVRFKTVYGDTINMKVYTNMSLHFSNLYSALQCSICVEDCIDSETAAFCINAVKSYLSRLCSLSVIFKNKGVDKNV